MSVATYTSSVFVNVAPKAVHVGNVTIQGQYVSGAATHTIGDIIFLAKIPHGAKIVDMAVDHSTTETALGVDYGLAKGGADQGAASYSIFASALATATVGRISARKVSGAGPTTVSVSDNDGSRFGIFSAKLASGSTTTSLIINFSITYRCDE